MSNARQIVPAAAYTAAGNSGSFNVLGVAEIVECEINCTAVGGTTPSLTPTLEASSDGGTTWYTLATGSAITGVSKQRLVAQQVLDDLVRVSWPLPTGTTPSVTLSFTFLFN